MHVGLGTDTRIALLIIETYKYRALKLHNPSSQPSQAVAKECQEVLTIGKKDIISTLAGLEPTPPKGIDF
jgi:hypothetical protein